MSFARAVLDFLQAEREEMVRLTSELIAIPTENPPGNGYGACRRLLVARLRQLGFDARTRGECVLAWCGQGRGVLYFHGHYDVVPAQDREQFTPLVRGKNLFGRGSSDMKSGLAAMAYAAKALQVCGAVLEGRIGLVFVADEETGGRRGSQAPARAGWLGRDGVGMLTAEPTGGAIWNANNGAISLRVTVLGKTAHVSLQHRGVNAFERMLDLVGPLRALKKRVERRPGSILLLGGRAEGGASFNAVPGEFTFTVDRRITPEEDLGAEKERLLGLLPASRCRVEVLQEGEAAQSSPDGALAQALAESVKRITGKAPKFEPCGGLLETRFYAKRGIPAFAYGPGLLTVSHGPKEFVPIDNIVSCAAAYALTAQLLLGRRRRSF